MSCALVLASLAAVGVSSPVLADDSVDTTTITDSASTNTVLVVTGMLVLAGLAMVGLTVWFWRTTQPDPEALGPLVTMSRRGFSRLDPIEQRRQLDQLRPSLAVTTHEEPAALPEMLAPIDDLPADDIPEVDEPADEASADDDPDDSHASDDLQYDDAPASRAPQINDRPTAISWDDDEWPDLDDWSDSSPEPHRPEPSTEPEPRRRPGPIDPLLG